jgi:hypothetical protein
MSQLKPGVEDFFENVGVASTLQHSLQRARLGQFPVVCGVADDGEKPILAFDLPGFLPKAFDQVAKLEAWVGEQVDKPWAERPSPARPPRTEAGPTFVVVDKGQADESGASAERTNSS